MERCEGVTAATADERGMSNFYLPPYVPVGTWRLKLWRALAPALVDHREQARILFGTMRECVWCGYGTLETGKASLEEYERWFWPAWEYIDKQAQAAMPAEDVWGNYYERTKDETDALILDRQKFMDRLHKNEVNVWHAETCTQIDIRLERILRERDQFYHDKEQLKKAVDQLLLLLEAKTLPGHQLTAEDAPLAWLEGDWEKSDLGT